MTTADACCTCKRHAASEQAVLPLQHPEKEELSQESADKLAALQEERSKQAGEQPRPLTSADSAKSAWSPSLHV